MRSILYLFLCAIVLLSLKALFIDDYIAAHYKTETNETVENNVSAQETSSVSDKNTSTVEPQQMSEDKKTPLERLGDTISKHIKL